MSINRRAFIKSMPLLLAALYSACSGNARTPTATQPPTPIVRSYTATPSAIPPTATATPTATPTPYPLPSSLEDVLAYEEGLKYVSKGGCFIKGRICYKSLAEYIQSGRARLVVDPILGPSIQVDDNGDGIYSTDSTGIYSEGSLDFGGWPLIYRLLGYDGRNRGRWYLMNGIAPGTYYPEDQLFFNIYSSIHEVNYVGITVYYNPHQWSQFGQIEPREFTFVVALSHDGFDNPGNFVDAQLYINKDLELVGYHSMSNLPQELIYWWANQAQTEILPDVIRSYKTLKELYVLLPQSYRLLTPTPTP